MRPLVFTNTVFSNDSDKKPLRQTTVVDADDIIEIIVLKDALEIETESKVYFHECQAPPATAAILVDFLASKEPALQLSNWRSMN